MSEMNVEPVGTALPATTADVVVRTQPRVDRAVLLLLAKFYGIILAAALVFTLVSAALLMAVDPDHAKGWDGEADTGGFGTAFYFAVVTAGTVGYGDVYPTNAGGRAVAAIMIFVTLQGFAVMTGELAAVFVTLPTTDLQVPLLVSL